MTVGTTMNVPEDLRSCIIHIASYNNKNLVGTLYNLYYGMEIPFENLTQLLFLMEDLMDDMKFPPASVQTRSFSIKPKPNERDSIPIVTQWTDRDTLATFQVKVLFRQGASWQGKVRWMEGGTELSFRSALELVKLMDSALPQPQAHMQTDGVEAVV